MLKKFLSTILAVGLLLNTAAINASATIRPDTIAYNNTVGLIITGRSTGRSYASSWTTGIKEANYQGVEWGQYKYGFDTSGTDEDYMYVYGYDTKADAGIHRSGYNANWVNGTQPRVWSRIEKTNKTTTVTFMGIIHIG
jgi:hypothetical protein